MLWAICVIWSCNIRVSRASPEGSLWCNGPCWSTGGTSSWVGVFCWVSLALKKGKGLRNGPSGSWVHPRCCSGSHRVTHSYTRCCSRPTNIRITSHKVQLKYIIPQNLCLTFDIYEILEHLHSQSTYNSQQLSEFHKVWLVDMQYAGRHYHMQGSIA